MNVHIVTAHPERLSLNGRMSAVATAELRSQGHTVSHTDLYDAAFDPREGPDKFRIRRNPGLFFPQDEQRFSAGQGALAPEVATQIGLLETCDLLMLQFPLWWFGVPAILKGWMDRVFAYGALYSGSRRFETGFMRGKRALLSVTTGSSEADCSPTGREGDTRLILWPTLYALRYVGFDLLEPHLVFGIRGGNDPDRESRDQRILLGYAEHLARIDERPLVPFNSADDWDHAGQLKPDATSHSPFIGHR